MRNMVGAVCGEGSGRGSGEREKWETAMRVMCKAHSGFRYVPAVAAAILAVVFPRRLTKMLRCGSGMPKYCSAVRLCATLVPR